LSLEKEDFIGKERNFHPRQVFLIRKPTVEQPLKQVDEEKYVNGILNDSF